MCSKHSTRNIHLKIEHIHVLGKKYRIHLDVHLNFLFYIYESPTSSSINGTFTKCLRYILLYV